MKTFESASSTVAWFKIADFVARGEKERALHMYPLLMHSVSDQAFSLQLEGDILLSFGDMLALERYHAAVQIYKKSGRIRQAISVYEHVSALVEDETVLQELLNLYLLCHDSTGFVQAFMKLSKFYIAHGYYNMLHELVNSYQNVIPADFFVLLYAQYVRTLLMYEIKVDDFDYKVEYCLELFIQSLQSHHNLEKDFQRFLSDLKALNIKLFEKAQNYLCLKS